MEKKNFNHFKRDNPLSIPIIILFGLIGYTAAFILLSSNYRDPDMFRDIYVMRNTSDNKLHEVSKDTLTLSEKLMVEKPVSIGKGQLLFTLNPNFLVWTALILIMFTLSSACLPVFIWQIIYLKNKFKLKAMHIWQSIAFAGLMIIFLIIVQLSLTGLYYPSQIIDNFNILFLHGWVVRAIAYTTPILQIPILILMFLVGISAQTVNYDIKDKLSIEKAISQFSLLNQSLTWALQILAVLVVFSVLTTGTLQQTIKSVLILKEFEVFPKEISYVYGMFFSLFLGIIYIPTYLYLKNRYSQLNKALEFGMESADEKTQELYEKLLKSDNFGGSAIDNLKLAFTVLAPLISGFLPEQLNLLH